MIPSWQNVRADQYRTYPERRSDWHAGYAAGCHDAGVANPSDPVPPLWHMTELYRSGFRQGWFDVMLRAQTVKAGQFDG